MVPPNVYGQVRKIYGKGTDGHDSFNITDTVVEVYNEQTRKTHDLKLAHYWPVRRARRSDERPPPRRPRLPP